MNDAFDVSVRRTGPSSRTCGGFVVLAAVGLIAACSSSSTGSGAASLASADSVWMHFETGDYELKLADYPGACALEQEGVSHQASSTYAAFHFTLAAGADSLPAGTYSVASDPTVSAPVEVEVKTLDSACNTTTDITATSGTLTIQEAMTSAGGDLDGSYSLTFADGTMTSGTFSAAFCVIPETSPAGTCVSGSGGTSFDAGSGSGSSPGGGDSTVADCSSCATPSLMGACASSAATCTGDSACATVLECVAACVDNGQTCVTGCEAGASETVLSELEPVIGCVCTSACTSECASQCATSGSSDAGGSTGSTEACGVDMSSAACASCVMAECCTENEACAGDSNCVALLSCIGGCNQDSTCENDCIDATTDTAAQELDNASECWTSSCGTQGC